MKLCGACGAEDATTECDVCHAAYYCNVTCQLDVFDLHLEYDCTGTLPKAVHEAAPTSSVGVPGQAPQCGLPSCAAEGTKRCTACTGWSTYYCSREHQRRDWEVHKVECQSSFSRNMVPRTSRGGKATSASVGGGTGRSAGAGASDGMNVGEGKDLNGLGPGGVCLCQGRTCPAAHLGHCREPAGASGRCASCRLLCACKLIGCGVHPDDARGLAVKCSHFAMGGGVRRCEACVEGSAGGRDAEVCACRDQWCTAHRGWCRELAGPTGRCFLCRLLCACTRGGCEVHPTPSGVRGSVMACPNFAVGGSVRRCEGCEAGDRKRNNRRPCLCSCMSRGRAPCSHPARECPGIAEAGSPNCAECTKKWCAESDRTPQSPPDPFYMQDGDPQDDLNEQFRREAHDARVAEGLSEEDSADEFDLSGGSTQEDEDSTTEDEPPVVSFFERVHRGRLRQRDPPMSSSGGAGGRGIGSESYSGETKGSGVHGGEGVHGGMQEYGGTTGMARGAAGAAGATRGGGKVCFECRKVGLSASSLSRSSTYSRPRLPPGSCLICGASMGYSSDDGELRL